VLSGVQGAHASLGGSAALDSACAPWVNELWAMDVRGLRRGLRTPGKETTANPIETGPATHGAATSAACVQRTTQPKPTKGRQK
jgi:hypothetical protein